MIVFIIVVIVLAVALVSHFHINYLESLQELYHHSLWHRRKHRFLYGKKQDIREWADEV